MHSGMIRLAPPTLPTCTPPLLSSDETLKPPPSGKAGTISRRTFHIRASLIRSPHASWMHMTVLRSGTCSEITSEPVLQHLHPGPCDRAYAYHHFLRGRRSRASPSLTCACTHALSPASPDTRVLLPASCSLGRVACTSARFRNPSWRGEQALLFRARPATTPHQSFSDDQRHRTRDKSMHADETRHNQIGTR